MTDPTGLVIRTVTGDIPAAELGPLDYHEHLFQISPLLAGDELTDEVCSGDEARSLRESGMRAMVEATPLGLGRNPLAVARISRRAKLHIIHTTGAHHAGHYAPGHPILNLTSAQLEARFTQEIRSGFREDLGAVPTSDPTDVAEPGSPPVRAGLVKAGIRYWSIGPFEHRVLAAAAATHAVTGSPIMVHLDFGSAAHEVLDELEREGASADSVVLAHIDRNLDPGLHTSLVERGAFLGYDGMARHREAPDSAILDCIATVAESGAAHGIVLGGDVARSSRYLAYGGMPGLRYLPVRFVPRLRSRLGDATTDQILVDNGRRLLAFVPR